MLVSAMAKDSFRRFSKLEGCQHIANEYALETILKICRDFKIKSILEVGLGIGAIADTVQIYYNTQNRNLNYSGTEANQFCLSVLPFNVKDFKSLILFDSIALVTENSKFDLIILDAADDNLEKLISLISASGIIFVEGGRGRQVQKLKQIFSNALHAEVISLKRNRPYGPFNSAHWMGGGQLIFVNPTLIQKMYWFKEKVITFTKYKLRKLYTYFKIK
jgi:hypothetical protein